MISNTADPTQIKKFIITFRNTPLLDLYHGNSGGSNPGDGDCEHETPPFGKRGVRGDLNRCGTATWARGLPRHCVPRNVRFFGAASASNSMLALQKKALE